MFTLKNFYKSDEWRSLVDRLKLERVNEDGDIVCAHCGKPIVKKYDCIGHHKIELTDANVNDYNISLNDDNIELIHFKCHNKVHERWGHEKPQQVYIVYGSPCSGKSTWVHDVMGKDDIVVDMDKIWECISSCDKYHKPNRLKQNVFDIRNTLINQIKMRMGRWKNAYIIGGYPLAMERKRLSEQVGGELIFIDTPKEVCLERAHNDEWKKFIEDWFDKFQE